MQRNAYTIFQIQCAFFIIILALFTTNINAQDPPGLSIEIYDADTLEMVGAVLLENKVYNIIVVPENDTEDELIVFNVTITVLEISTITSFDSPYYQFIAPSFEEYGSFIITAVKEGYRSAALEVTIIKGQLSVTVDRMIVEEKKEFIVTVKDIQNNPIEDAVISLTSTGSLAMTDIQGLAYVKAPEVQQSTNLLIQVTKNGYLPASTVIRVENVAGSGLDFSAVQFLQVLPVLLAVLVVIFAVVFVFWRKKRAAQMPSKEVAPSSSSSASHEPASLAQARQGRQLNYGSSLFSVDEKKTVNVSTSNSKVEEIRIPVQEKKKETTYLAEDKTQEPSKEDFSKDHDEWFKGQNYMRYKLDELTGKIDQKTDGKWFEGERDCKYKVDETLKKSVKKKKNNDEENK